MSKGDGELKQIESDIYGVLKVGGTQVGKLFCDGGNPDLDKWRWTNGNPFPSSGFLFVATALTGTINPTVKYKAEAFSGSKQTPTQKWPIANKVFTVKLNGKLVAWMEVQTGAAPDQNWWSNGQSLTANRKLLVQIGDTLTFSSGSLPSAKQYPLNAVLVPV